MTPLLKRSHQWRAILPGWLKQTVIISASFGAGLGLGTMGTFVLLLSDRPNMVVQDRWRTVEVPTPVKGIEPTTPFGIDPNVYILDLPITTTTTMKPAPAPVPVPPPPVTTTTTMPPATTATTVTTEPKR